MMYLLILVFIFLSGCSQSFNISDGAGSETTNSIIGHVVYSDGKPASNAQVQLILHNYNPVTATIPDSMIDTTDQNGRYRFIGTNSYTYSLQAVQLSQRTRLFRQGIFVDSLEDSILVPDDTLKVPGVLKIVLPDTIDSINGYLYIPGTIIALFIIDAGSFVILDSVPAGALPALIYGIKNSSIQKVIRYNIPVIPGDTTIISMPAWKYSKQLYLNTTASGADVAGTVTDFPVLVRLSSSIYNFAEAQINGNDIRFTKSDDVTSLPYEIEQWDEAAGQAAIWVRIDTVYGNNSTQSIMMYWGNPDASSASNSAAVFDTATGFQGVWHLSERQGVVARDATQNRYDGTKLGQFLPATAPGAIGNAQEFDGSSSLIQMVGTANSKLNFPENGHYTLSAWVNVDTLVDSTTHVIASKGCEQYFLKLYSQASIGGQEHQWEFTEFHDRVGWQVSNYTPAQAKSWKFIVGVREGSSQFLFLDGNLVNSSYVIDQDTIARNTGDDFSIGKYLRFANYPQQGFCWFDGKIDEVRVSSVARSADWIKLNYMCQKQPSALVVFK